MKERTNTSDRLQLIPEGTHSFMVAGEVKILKVGPKKDMTMYIFPVQYAKGLGEQSFMANQAGPILEFLGAKKIGESQYEWDTTEFEGKAFLATVSHFIDKKGVERSGMKDVKAVPEDNIPF